METDEVSKMNFKTLTGRNMGVQWDVGHLRVQREGLREPEGVGVIFVVVSKLLTLNNKSIM